MEKELYSEKITAGKRTYFIDIKQTVNGSKYLQITESKLNGETFERFKIMIFEEDIAKFSEAFVRILLKLNIDQPQSNNVSVIKKKDDKSHIDRMKETYENAYQPWTIEDDEKLELLFKEGKTIKELAIEFKRNRGAIEARIKKLNLI